MALSSFEGMYVADSQPKIFLGSRRPAGRLAYTCAHEVGHHVLGHGSALDELRDEMDKRTLRSPIEVAADVFAATLLMPRAAIVQGIRATGQAHGHRSPLEVYALACWLGVGYATAVRQLRNLRIIEADVEKALLKHSVSSIRASLGHVGDGAALLVTEAWVDRAVDCCVADLLIIESDCIAEGESIEVVDRARDRTIIRASRPGIARVQAASAGWSSFVRVSKREFTGRSCFRFLEEAEE